MQIETSTLISLTSVVLALLSFIMVNKRSNKAELQKDTAQIASVLFKLEAISTTCTEIKAEMKDVKNEIRDTRDKMIVVEQSLKSAWHRIEAMENQFNITPVRGENS